MEKPDDEPTPYNKPDLVAMKEDIANRSFNIKVKGMVITAIFAVLAIGAMFLMPAAGVAMAKPLLMGGLALGGAVTTMVTMREAKKLELDEQYIQSYMQGKNYWGEGYRKEVAEHGYGGPQITTQGPPMGPRKQGAGRQQ